MREIKAQPLTKETFAPFGRYTNMFEERKAQSPDFESYMVEELHMRGQTKIGITICQPGDFDSISMERHFLTEEALFCGDADTVLTVANSDPEGAPKADDVTAFYMRPGDLVVLNKEIWHDANHGVDTETMYYFMISDSEDDPREIEFVTIEPNPVHVTVK